MEVKGQMNTEEPLKRVDFGSLMVFFSVCGTDLLHASLEIAHVFKEVGEVLYTYCPLAIRNRKYLIWMKPTKRHDSKFVFNVKLTFITI